MVALPDFAKFVSNGRVDVVPGRTFFVTGKAAGMTAFDSPSQQSAIDLNRALFEVQAGRRFQR